MVTKPTTADAYIRVSRAPLVTQAEFDAAQGGTTLLKSALRRFDWCVMG
jgi:hypothetical protein